MARTFGTEVIFGKTVQKGIAARVLERANFLTEQTFENTGTDPDTGVTYLVHESVGPDTAPQTILTYNRLETYDARGRQVGAAETRKLRTRWWQRDEFTEALTAAGFEKVTILGDEDGWVALAR